MEQYLKIFDVSFFPFNFQNPFSMYRNNKSMGHSTSYIDHHEKLISLLIVNQSIFIYLLCSYVIHKY